MNATADGYSVNNDFKGRGSCGRFTGFKVLFKMLESVRQNGSFHFCDKQFPHQVEQFVTRLGYT